VGVIREDAERVHEDAVAAGGEREDVEEDVIDGLGRAKEEASFRAAPCDQVDGPGQNAAREPVKTSLTLAAGLWLVSGGDEPVARCLPR
jgi:hypothetical protein